MEGIYKKKKQGASMKDSVIDSFNANKKNVSS